MGKFRLSVLFVLSFTFCFTVGMLVGNEITKVPTYHGVVCNKTQLKPVMAAAVDPNSGVLFAVPTLQTVCIDVRQEKDK